MSATQDKPLKKLEGLLSEANQSLYDLRAYADNIQSYVKVALGKVEQIRILSTELHKTLGPDDAVAMMDAVSLLVDQYRKNNPELKSVVDPFGTDGWYIEGDTLMIRIPKYAHTDGQTGDPIGWQGGWGVVDDDGNYFTNESNCREYHDTDDYSSQLPSWIVNPLRSCGFTVDHYAQGEYWFDKVKKIGITKKIQLVYEES